MEKLQHIIGACHDNHTHLDLIDLGLIVVGTLLVVKLVKSAINGAARRKEASTNIIH